MSLSIHEAAVPLTLRTLRALSGVLEKGRLHAGELAPGVLDDRAVTRDPQIATRIEGDSDIAARRTTRDCDGRRRCAAGELRGGELHDRRRRDGVRYPETTRGARVGTGGSGAI